VPLLVGTAAIAHHENVRGRKRVAVQEPPVDLAYNNPGIRVGEDEFRKRWDLSDHASVLVIVSRLAHELKLEGILSAIRSLVLMPRGKPIRLVIVGGGPAADEVERAAEEVNAGPTGHRVVLTGELLDPRPAYAAADIVLGMGGSALRGLAFGKPLVVQGERGYWKLLTPSSLPTFLWQGWYGIGEDARNGPSYLAEILGELLPDNQRAKELGEFGLATVRSRFSLERAAAVQAAMYAAAFESTPQPIRDLSSEFFALGQFLGYESRRRWARMRGMQQSDDFNTRPVAIPREKAGSTIGG
jgi:L-malate glycosyltransferase